MLLIIPWIPLRQQSTFRQGEAGHYNLFIAVGVTATLPPLFFSAFNPTQIAYLCFSIKRKVEDGLGVP
jgi:hypothetical protein